MIKKLPIGEFKGIKKGQFLKFDEEFIKCYDENSEKRFISEASVEYPKLLGMLDIDLPF